MATWTVERVGESVVLTHDDGTTILFGIGTAQDIAMAILHVTQTGNDELDRLHDIGGW